MEEVEKMYKGLKKFIECTDLEEAEKIESKITTSWDKIKRDKTRNLEALRVENLVKKYENESPDKMEEYKALKRVFFSDIGMGRAIRTEKITLKIVDPGIRLGITDLTFECGFQGNVLFDVPIEYKPLQNIQKKWLYSFQEDKCKEEFFKKLFCQQFESYNCPDISTYTHFPLWITGNYKEYENVDAYKIDHDEEPGSGSCCDLLGLIISDEGFWPIREFEDGNWICNKGFEFMDLYMKIWNSVHEKVQDTEVTSELQPSVLRF